MKETTEIYSKVSRTIQKGVEKKGININGKGGKRGKKRKERKGKKKKKRPVWAWPVMWECVPGAVREAGQR